MIDEKRRAQFRAVITAASLVANNDIAETMAVLIGAIGAVIVGLLIFGPRLLALIAPR